MVEKGEKKGFSGLMVFGIITMVMVVTAAGTIFAVRVWLFPSPFTPVALSQQEERNLESKLFNFEKLVDSSTTASRLSDNAKQAADVKLSPEAYRETGANRTISFSEREINSLLANNTNLADKLAIDLADNLVSAKLLIPVDPDFPVFGGKTLRVKAGVELAYSRSRPIVILKGVSVMGVPIPSEWMGGLKNIDLVEKYGGDEGFWKTFSAGVDSITVADGQLWVKLKK